MASNISLPIFHAGGTIRRARFVKGDTSNDYTVLEADANERTMGIATDSGRAAAIPSVDADPPEAAQDGEPVELAFPGELALLEVGSGGCTAFDRLKSDGDGKGVAIASSGTTIQQIGAVALADALEDELVEVMVVFTSERPDPS